MDALIVLPPTHEIIGAADYMPRRLVRIHKYLKFKDASSLNHLKFKPHTEINNLSKLLSFEKECTRDHLLDFFLLYTELWRGFCAGSESKALETHNTPEKRMHGCGLSCET